VILSKDIILNITVEAVEDCQRFQSDLDRLNEGSLVNKFDLNAEKCEAISFLRNVGAVQFDYRISGSALGRVEEIKDLGVLLDSRMTYLCHIEAVISKSTRILGFIKHDSREFGDLYPYKVLYVSLVRPKLEYAASPHQGIHSARVERIQYSFVRLRVLD
jgi:hypothetical protein